MKLFKYLLIGLSSLIFFTSCEDFLEAETQSGFSDDVIFSNESLTEQYLNGIYQEMAVDKVYRKAFDQYFYGNTDVENHTGSDYSYDKTDYYSVIQYNAVENNTSIYNNLVWDGIYRCIEVCNVAVSNIAEYGSPVVDTKMGMLYAEALTMRAYLYYDLIKFYGDVPARFEPMTKDNMLVPITNRDSIYRQILSDLETAASYAQWGGSAYTSTIERPTKESILGLYARIALSYVGYSQRPLTLTSYVDQLSVATNSQSQICRTVGDAEKLVIMTKVRDYLSTVIAYWEAKGGRLESNYENVFVEFLGGEISPVATEYMWAFNYRSYLTFMWSMPCAVGDYTAKTTQSKWKVVPTLYFDYDTNDNRRDVTCPLYEFVNSAGTANLHPIVAKLTEIPFGKYRAEWIDPQIDSDGDSYKVPVMRYSDILLMYAEATLTAGDGAGITGQAALDMVRSRAGVSSVPLTLDNIIDERAFELAGERLRREDLIRWGKLSEKIKEASSRCVDLANATGDFVAYTHVAANDGVIYWRPSSTETFTGTSMNKFEFYGLFPGETDDKTVTDSLGGWSKTLTDDSEAPSSNYKFWTTDGTNRIINTGDGSPYYQNFYTQYYEPDEHQLLPISDITIANSQGMLSNSYGY